MGSMKIKRGDKVVVIRGNDRGKVGVVVRAFPRQRAVIVEGVRLAKRHAKPRPGSREKKGRVVEVAMPIPVSNVAIVDPKTGKPSRIRIERRADGTRVRIAVRSSTALDS